MNGHYIRGLEVAELSEKIKALELHKNLTDLPNIERILEVEKTRLVTLCDITTETDLYMKTPKYNPALLIFKKSTEEATLKGLEATLSYFTVAKWPDSIEGLNKVLADIVTENKLTNGDLFWPIRVALSGLEKSPSPAELMWALGKEESLVRINSASALLK